MLKTFAEFNKIPDAKASHYDQIVDYFKANAIEESDEGESPISITGVDNIAIPEATFSNINIIKRRHNNKRKRL